ncbi:MAG TPA: EscU/YscU/HrcU family type III secretion system export apparatus switch protein [Novosphingobium sp.]
MADGELDKSEQPTQFKLQQARHKGIVARGRDLGFLISLVVLLLYVRASGAAFVGSLASSAREVWISGPLVEDSAAIFTIMPALFGPAAKWLALLFAALFLATLVFEVVQTGVVFSAKPLKPDFSRLNPAQGLKRLFSMQMLLETGKNLLKFASYVIVALLVIWQALETDIGTVTDGRSLAVFMSHIAGLLLLGFVLAAVTFAALDQVLSRRMFLRNMRMSRREIKREMRDREGDPRLKQKRKQLHANFVKASQSIRNLPGADVLVTNPQHIAIALRYDGASMPAPQIVSMGTNQMAQRLKGLATAYGIPIIEDRPLARALNRAGVLDRFVPESSFAAVASIYNQLRRTGQLRRAVP